jgi:hypothetical protein
VPRLPVRRTLVLLIAAAILAGGGFAAGVAFDGIKGKFAAREDPSTRIRYRHRLSLFAVLKSRPDLVMLGDSITESGAWAELLGRPAANRALGGDTSALLLKRLDVSVPDSARTVVIMIGLNDLKDSEFTPERTAANVETILRRLQGRRVILQSVLYDADASHNARIDALNARYAALCAQGLCEWLDLQRTVTVAGSYDGRHLAGPAYLAWAEALKAKL